MELTILAVTKMQEDHIYIGGINNEGEWIRPVKESRLKISDLFVNDKPIIKNFNKIELPLKKKLSEILIRCLT